MNTRYIGEKIWHGLVRIAHFHARARARYIIH
jgi:hypothetical protein